MGLLSWISYSYFGAWLNGRKDGKRGIPRTPEEHAPYEKRLVHIANENIGRVAQKWEDEDQKLKSEFCEAKREYLDANKDCKKGGKDHSFAAKNYDDALKKKRGSSDYLHISSTAYKILMVIIGVLEIPLTTNVFDIFGENRILTYLFAAALCISLPISAHLLGVMIKEKFDKKVWIIFSFNLLVFVGVIVAIAYIREKFFEASEFQKVLGVQMDPTMVTIVFILIQVFIFTVATTASSFAHDPHPQLRRSLKEFKDAKKRLEDESKDLIEAEERVDKAAEVLAKIEAIRDTTFKMYQNKVIEIKAIQERHIEVYRTQNLRKRKDFSFGDYPPIEIPKSLQEIDVDCGITDDLNGELYQEEKNS